MTRQDFILESVIAMLGNTSILVIDEWIQERIIKSAIEMADNIERKGVPFDSEDINYVLETRLERIEESLDNIESTIKINMK